MMKPLGTLFLTFLLIVSSSGSVSAAGKPVDFQNDLNAFFSDFDATFTKIVSTGAVKSTDLKQAERLFVREMKAHQAFNTFIRTNSKGAVIAELVRAEKVERPMRDVSDQKWFKEVSGKKSAYYSLVKDDERGRYYLLWARPILKPQDRFVGSVLLKIDLWDSFYEFSNSIYEPFLIKLGRKSLFAHKWGEGERVTEKAIAVPGVDRISVVYLSENSGTGSAETTVAPAAPAPAAAVPSVDTPKAAPVEKKAAEKKATKKKDGSGILVFFLILIILGIAGASMMLIAWMRRRALLRSIDNDDTL
jgi:hypothetical protein